MVSAPSPTSVDVKLPWPKYGKTALPVISIGRLARRRVDGDVLADAQPELAQHRGAERDLAGGGAAGGQSSTVGDIIGPVPGPGRSRG